MATEIKTIEPAIRPGNMRLLLTRLGPFIGLLLVVVIFTLLSDSPGRYLSPFNLRIVLAQTVIVALGAIGMTMIIVSSGIDLSVGSAIALTGVVTALGIQHGWSPVLAVIAGIVAGGIIGLVNGLAITRLRVVPFIATLGMLGIARGVAKWLSNQQTVNVPTTWVNDLAVTVPTPSWLLLGDADVTIAPGRSISSNRGRTRHHRGSSDRRGKPGGWRRNDSWLDDRCPCNGLFKKWMPTNGLAKLCAGNNHRHHHRHCCRSRSLSTRTCRCLAVVLI